MNNLEIIIEKIWEGIEDNPYWSSSPITNQEKQLMDDIWGYVRNDKTSIKDAMLSIVELYVQRLGIKRYRKYKNNINQLNSVSIWKYANDFILLWKLWKKEIK